MELIEALIRAQANWPAALPRTKTVQAGKRQFKYAPLDDVLEATLPHLRAEGILLYQPPVTTEHGGPALETHLIGHGGTLSARLPIRADIPPQDMADAISRFRRYMALSMLGIAMEDDELQPETKEYKVTTSGREVLAANPEGRGGKVYADSPMLRYFVERTSALWGKGPNEWTPVEKGHVLEDMTGSRSFKEFRGLPEATRRELMDGGVRPSRFDQIAALVYGGTRRPPEIDYRNWPPTRAPEAPPSPPPPPPPVEEDPPFPGDDSWP